MTAKSKMIIGICASLMLAAVVAITAVLMVSGSNSKEYQKHMELAQQYLDELQYEQAIAEYELAIGIEPKNMEAYQALAELYVEMDDYESAVTVLNRGLEQTDGEELADYLAEVQKTWEERKDLESETQRQPIDSQEQEAAQASGPKEETEYSDDGSYKVSEYDISGKLVKETFYNSDGTMTYYTVSEYDVSGKLVKETSYNPDGTMSSCWVYEYDASWNLVKRTEYTPEGTMSHYSVFEYDATGNRVKETVYHYNPDGTMRSYSVNEYDATGNRVKETNYHPDGTQWQG